MDLIRSVGFPEERALIDHNTEETLPLVLDTGCWAGHTIYPHTKMDEVRMVKLVKEYGSERILINSAADWGISDPLKVPKTTDLMLESGITLQTIRTIVWDNPAHFFSQSQRLDLADIDERPSIDQTEIYGGSTVLRGGQTPVVES